jgi:hypothetical protein
MKLPVTIATPGTPTMRIALLLSSLAFAACTVGEVGTANNTGPDGGSGSGSDPNTACVARLAPADPPHTHAAGGTSNKGQNCIAAGCHLNNNLGAGAPGFEFAGTVYAGTTTNPSAGALVRIISGPASAPTVLKTYTDADGNFYFSAGALSGSFMATTNVTACPTVTPMTTTLVGGSGGGGGTNSCNLCHTTGAGAQAAPISL